MPVEHSQSGVTPAGSTAAQPGPPRLARADERTLQLAAGLGFALIAAAGLVLWLRYGEIVYVSHLLSGLAGCL